MTHEFIGNTYRFNYGDFVAVDSFTDTEVSFEVVEGPVKGLSGKASYTAHEVAPGTYAISWQEADGSTVVHLDNFTTGVSLSFFTDSACNFYRMEGHITQIT